jgi:hypothetical protein
MKKFIFSSMFLLAACSQASNLGLKESGVEAQASEMSALPSIVVGRLGVTGKLSKPAETIIVARAQASEPDNYSEACYSFQYGTHNQETTRNDYDIEYSGENISAIQVVDNIGVIADLGAGSCQEIVNKYEQGGKYPGKGAGGYPHKQDRLIDPMFWFEYSSAMEVLQRSSLSSSVMPTEGHCYVINKVTSRRRVLALFHVKKIQARKSIAIDEIEVILRQTFQP